MKGRNIRNNLVSVSCIVLVGLRDWESLPKNCDILCVYDDRDIDRLKTLPNVDISHVLQIRFTNSNFGANTKENIEKSEEITFTNDIGVETETDKAIQKKTFIVDFAINEDEQVNIDDI
jgi:hypothetical protein